MQRGEQGQEHLRLQVSYGSYSHPFVGSLRDREKWTPRCSSFSGGPVGHSHDDDQDPMCTPV